MRETTKLINGDALRIRDGEHVWYGGDQAWYTDLWQRQAGCGPTNCANLLWYLAATRAGGGPLCPYDGGEKAGFLRLMEAVWNYVTPSGMGVNSPDVFIAGALRYGEAQGVPLTAERLPVPPLYRGARDYAGMAAFITRALERDLPVAFLNLSNGKVRDLESWHWVTLTALRGDDAMICDEGRSLWICLRQWADSSILGGGFVTLDLKS